MSHCGQSINPSINKSLQNFTATPLFTAHILDVKYRVTPDLGYSVIPRLKVISVETEMVFLETEKFTGEVKLFREYHCIGPLHWTIALDHCIGPLHWTIALDLRIGPSHWTIALDHCIGPLQSVTRKFSVHVCTDIIPGDIKPKVDNLDAKDVDEKKWWQSPFFH